MKVEAPHNEDLTSVSAVKGLLAVSPDWLGLTRAISGCPFGHEKDSALVLSLLIPRAATSDVQGRFLQHLNPHFYPSQSIISRIVQALVSIANILRTDADVSIIFIDNQLVRENVFLGDTEEDSGQRLSRAGLIFMAIGWITNLFDPVTSSSSSPDGTLAINTERATCFETSTVSPTLTSRPIVEMIRHFGDLLPTRRPDQFESNQRGFGNQEAEGTIAETLQVASINVSSLERIGGIKIEWTSCLSSHLDFDPARFDAISGNVVPVLKIFRYPSLCYQHAPDSSVLQKLLANWYDEHTKPPGFSANGLIQEILISYKLLVLFDRNARKLYRDTLRKRVLGDLFDRELDALCLAQVQNWYQVYSKNPPFHIRETFYATSDFPIFSARLMHLENFIDSIQPNRISSLWKDKRDILRWYTFWAVVILGALNLVIALAQVGLAAAQVELSRQALKPGG